VARESGALGPAAYAAMSWHFSVLREQLRARGIEPGDDRPPGYVKGGGIPSGPLSPRTESQLDYWVELKRARDFEMADKVREELRKRGIEPGNLR